MRYLLALTVVAMAAAAHAADKPVPTIARAVKIDEPNKTFIVEDIETGCQTIIMIAGNFLNVSGVSIPRLTPDGKPWCRNTAP